MTAAPEVDVKAPEVVDGLSIEDYHSDKESISSSGLRALLAPGCPAQFRYDRDHPKPPKREFDLGNAVHAEILGDGHTVVDLDYPDYRTADARAERDDAYDAGHVPLLPHEREQVNAMAAAVRAHPLAGPLLAPGTGIAERSLYWTDPATGIRCRVRPDWLTERAGVVLGADIKTTADAEPTAVSRTIRDYAYHQQDALYVDGIHTVLDAPDVRLIFVFISKKPPHLITARELQDPDRDIGRARNRRALDIYARCLAEDNWPDWTGSVDTIPRIGMPPWDTTRQQEEYLR